MWRLGNKSSAADQRSQTREDCRSGYIARRLPFRIEPCRVHKNAARNRSIRPLRPPRRLTDVRFSGPLKTSLRNCWKLPAPATSDQYCWDRSACGRKDLSLLRCAVTDYSAALTRSDISLYPDLATPRIVQKTNPFQIAQRKRVITTCADTSPGPPAFGVIVNAAGLPAFLIESWVFTALVVIRDTPKN